MRLFVIILLLICLASEIFANPIKENDDNRESEENTYEEEEDSELEEEFAGNDKDQYVGEYSTSNKRSIDTENNPSIDDVDEPQETLKDAQISESDFKLSNKNVNYHNVPSQTSELEGTVLTRPQNMVFISEQSQVVPSLKNDEMNGAIPTIKKTYNEKHSSDVEIESHDFDRKKRNLEPPLTRNDLRISPKVERNNEDVESIIKRQIKKLSLDEFEELLNSLSSNKKILLKKIINDESNDNIDKREIIKKAEAVEDSNLFENGFDMNKINKSSNDESNSPLLINVRADISTSNSIDSFRKSEPKETLKADSLPSSLSKSDNNTFLHSNENLNSFIDTKLTSKREINKDDKSIEESDYTSILYYESDQANSPNHEYEYSQNESLPPAFNKDTNLKNKGNSDTQLKLTDSLKQLEDSFPNESASFNLNNGPLVRVKRTNTDTYNDAMLFNDKKDSSCMRSSNFDKTRSPNTQKRWNNKKLTANLFDSNPSSSDADNMFKNPPPSEVLDLA